MIAIVLAGFWPYFSALPAGRSTHWVIHVHAAIFSGWMLLYLAQVTLVYRRQIRTHQALGRFGIYYGLLVLLFGVVVTFAAPVLNVQAGRTTLDEAAGFLVRPIGDMLLFGGFFWRQWQNLAGRGMEGDACRSWAPCSGAPAPDSSAPRSEPSSRVGSPVSSASPATMK